MKYTLDETTYKAEFYLETGNYKVKDSMLIEDAVNLIEEAYTRDKLFLTDDEEYQIGVKGDFDNQAFYFKGELDLEVKDKKKKGK